MQNSLRHFHLIWADKLALCVAALGLFVAVVLWALVAVAAGILGANHVFAIWGMTSISYSFGGAVLLWLALRAIDFAAKGATYALVKGHAAENFSASSREPPTPLIGTA